MAEQQNPVPPAQPNPVPPAQPNPVPSTEPKPAEHQATPGAEPGKVASGIEQSTGLKPEVQEGPQTGSAGK